MGSEMCIRDRLKYALVRQKTLSPYTRLGLGFSTFNNKASKANSIVAENRTSSHIMVSIGVDILLGQKFGLYLETNYEWIWPEGNFSFYAWPWI